MERLSNISQKSGLALAAAVSYLGADHGIDALVLDRQARRQPSSDIDARQLLPFEHRAHPVVRLDGNNVILFFTRRELSGEFACAGAEVDNACAFHAGETTAAEEGVDTRRVE